MQTKRDPNLLQELTVLILNYLRSIVKFKLAVKTYVIRSLKINSLSGGYNLLPQVCRLVKHCTNRIPFRLSFMGKDKLSVR